MFFYVLIFLAFLELFFLFTRLQISIKNLKISTENSNINVLNQNKKILNDNYKIIICLYITKKIKLLKKEITKEDIEKLDIRNKLNKINIKKIKFDKFQKNKIKEIQRYKPKIKYINLRLDLGLEDTVYTSYVNALVSTVIGILLKNQICNSKDSRFIINPIYANKNIFKMELNCIFEIKMIHIIYIIYILTMKRRSDKNGRTSDRRTYDYSYE